MFTQKLTFTVKNVIYYCLLFAIAGSFISNALLSICCILLCVITIFCFKKQDVFNAYTLSVITIIGIAFASLIWSNNIAECWQRCLVKLPLLLLLLPLHHKISIKQCQYIIYFLIICTLAAIFFTTYNYFTNYEAINESYKIAKVMPSFFVGDHIRFSWFIVLGNLLVLNWVRKYASTLNYVLSATLWVCSFIFLHLLASKTGLLCLYISCFGLMIYYFKQHKTIVTAALCSTIFTVLLLLNYSKSLQNRIRYVQYDLNNIYKGNFVSGLSDGARIISLKAGIAVGNENPLLGVGFGDLKEKIKNWHHIHNPNSKDYEIFLPTNQFIIYYGATGIFGALLFSLAMFIILFYKKYNFYHLLTHLILLVPLITDDTLERQHGVFTFVLFYLLSNTFCTIETKKE